MITLKERDYVINVCTDIIEWAKEFYDMPDGSVILDVEQITKECMGFASLDDKQIWIFVPKMYDLKDLKETIAHEIGHIIEMKYPVNFKQIKENDELHEMKANYYMDFYLLVDKIVLDVIEELNTIEFFTIK